MKTGLLAGLFFITAGLYASVGFGGGSTYTALLILAATDYALIPVIALTCNILVVSGNVTRYAKAGLIDLKKTLPLVLTSIPAAWIGGRLNISETVFIGLLWVALFLAGLRLLFDRPPQSTKSEKATHLSVLNPLIGGAIGFYSGLVGIGGGIFLAPVLHLMRWGSSLHIAATCSFFILVNSLSGVWGQLTKLQDLSKLGEATAYWPLIPAVLVGGFLGNRIGIKKLSDHWLKRLTGLLILFVALRLAWRWAGLVF